MVASGAGGLGKYGGVGLILKVKLTGLTDGLGVGVNVK